MLVLIIFLAIVIPVGCLVGVTILIRRETAKKTKRLAQQFGMPTLEPTDLEVPPLPTDEEIKAAGLPTETLKDKADQPPKLRDRLTKTRAVFASILGHKKVESETWDEIEEALILADVGIGTATTLMDQLKEEAKKTNATDESQLIDLLKQALLQIFDNKSRSLQTVSEGCSVWLFVGVNGVGKTTTIAKVAQSEVDAGATVVLAAADTFRAAASDQLAQWATRTNSELIRGQDGADPASVVFDAMAAAQSRNANVLLVDTAGRLHTKTNLMEELKKLHRVIERTPDALQEVLLVIDATTGQNGLTQAKEFASAVGVTGVVLTKLDGTAKGGIVVAIEHELKIPVKLVGIGEGSRDLLPFDPTEFVDALFN